MKREFRLTRTADFKRVRRIGKSFAHPQVVLISAPNELQQPRVGISAGRAVGGAVQRNRAKRVLRAAMQPLLAGINSGHDIILLARKPILDVGSEEVRAVLEKLLTKAKLND